MSRFHHLIAVLLTLFGLALAVPSQKAWAGSVSFPVSVPPECFSLAQREGVPTMLENRYQAVKARLKLARLSGRDPMVQECRAAVKRAVAALKREQIVDKERGKLAHATATE